METLIKSNYFIILVLALGLSACSSFSQQTKPHFAETGLASYYADKYQGRLTASGEPFNQYAKTAAHKTLPFGTVVKVVNLNNSRYVVVRINDRGPFVKGRVIDLSKSAFNSIASLRKGVIRVRMTTVE